MAVGPRHKVVVDEYRSAARVLLAGTTNVTVGPWAHVQTTEGGAFVEVTLFVPASELEKQKPQ